MLFDFHPSWCAQRMATHPRVTAVAKREQPPRRLPSPATRARDLQKDSVAIFLQLLSPAQDSDTHVRSVEFSVIPARVSGARGLNSAGGRGEGPGFFARQPRARMTEREIEQDRNRHHDSQSSIGHSRANQESTELFRVRLDSRRRSAVQSA